MSNPLDRFLAEQSQQGSPLDRFLAESDQGDPASQTAIGRRNMQAESIARLQQLLERKDITAQQRKRIEGLIAQWKSGAETGYGSLVRYPWAVNMAKGAVAGMVNATPMAADLALTLPDLALRAVGKTENPFRQVRAGLHEKQQLVREGMDVRGIGGTIGEFAGGMANPIALGAYGKAAQLTGKAIQAAAPSSAIANAIGAGVTGNVGQRIAAQVATGIPINALQSASLDDASAGDRAKQFGLGTALDVASGLVFRRPTPRIQVDPNKPTGVEIEVTGKGPETPPTEGSVQAEALKRAQEKAAKGELLKRQKVERKYANQGAMVDWIKEDPTRTPEAWAALDPEAKKVLIAAHVERNQDKYALIKAKPKVEAVVEPTTPAATPTDVPISTPKQELQTTAEAQLERLMQPYQAQASSQRQLRVVSANPDRNSIVLEYPNGRQDEFNLDVIGVAARQSDLDLAAAYEPLYNEGKRLMEEAVIARGQQQLSAATAVAKLLEPEEEVQAIVNDPKADPSTKSMAQAVAKQALKKQGTFLKTVKHDKPLEELTLDRPKSGDTAIDKLKDKLDDFLEKNPNSKEALEDLNLLVKFTPKVELPSKTIAPPSPRAPVVETKPQAPVAPAIVETPALKLDPNRARILFGKKFDKMTPEELTLHEEWLRDRLSQLAKGEGEEYESRLAKLTAFKTPKPAESAVVSHGNVDALVNGANYKRIAPLQPVASSRWGNNIWESVWAPTAHEPAEYDDVLGNAIRELLSNHLPLQRLANILARMDEDIAANLLRQGLTTNNQSRFNGWTTNARVFGQNFAPRAEISPGTGATIETRSGLGIQINPLTIALHSPRLDRWLTVLNQGLTFPPWRKNSDDHWHLAADIASTLVHEYIHNIPETKIEPDLHGTIFKRKLNTVISEYVPAWQAFGEDLADAWREIELDDESTHLFRNLTKWSLANHPDGFLQGLNSGPSAAWSARQELRDYVLSRPRYATSRRTSMDPGSSTREGAGFEPTPEQRPPTPAESSVRERGVSDASTIQRRLDGLREFRERSAQAADLARRQEEFLTKGLKAQLPPGLAGGLVGFVTGYNAADDDASVAEKLAMASLWAAIGGLGTRALAKRLSPEIPKSINVPEPISNELTISHQIGQEAKPKPLKFRLQELYTGATRSVYPAERLVSETGWGQMPAQVNWFKRVAMYGRALARTEGWLTDRPNFINEKGELQYYDGVKSWNDIWHGTAQGDIDGLSKLLIARTSIEQYGKRTVPLEVPDAQRIIANAPAHLHQAADEARAYFGALLDILRRGGRISNDGYKAALDEEWYAPLWRVMTGSEISLLNRGGKQSVSTPQALYGRKKHGNKITVRSPYEVGVEMTARTMRAEEFQQTVNSLRAWAQSLPADVGSLYVRRVQAKQHPKFDKIHDEIDRLAKASKLSYADAEKLSYLVDTEPQVFDTPKGKAYLINTWQNGERITLRVSEPVFNTFKSLTPLELDTWVKFLGAPARVASQAIVNNPYFPVIQSFKDTFHATLSSRYGFVPFYDSFRGWWHVVTRSPEYQKLILAGGPGTIQSLRYANPGTAVRAVGDVGKSALDVAGKQIRDGRFFDAYKTLIYPFAEAARVGEYLRALGHGASTLEGVYAAWNVMGNVRMQGSSRASQIFNYMTIFARPAAAAIDETLAFTGMHPFRQSPTGATRPMALASFLAKGLGTIVPISAYLWYANKDDKEINALRRTESGSRFWYVRMGDESIMRIPKPQVVGPIFGTAAEQALDAQFAKDPAGTTNWLKSMFDDAAINMVPTIGVIPFSLYANKVLGLGTPIVNQGDVALDASLQGADRASGPAKGISELLVKATSWAEPTGAWARAVSPAGIDFIVRSLGGYSGEDLFRSIDYVDKWISEGGPPPTQEMPVVGRLLSRRPTANLAEIQEYYKRMDKIDRVAKSVNEMVGNQQFQRLVPYMQDNMIYQQLLPIYGVARSDINQWRRAIDDIRGMPDQAISAEFRRTLEQTYINLIEARAMSVNKVARAILRSQ